MTKLLYIVQRGWVTFSAIFAIIGILLLVSFVHLDDFAKGVITTALGVFLKILTDTYSAAQKAPEVKAAKFFDKD